MTSFLLRRLSALRRDHTALAMVEFALSLPLLIILGITGAELANFVTTKMRISQIALMVADNGSRMGSSTASATAVSENDIKDTFTGAQIQSAALDIQTNGRIIMSQLEPTANPNTAQTYKISWQRCYGAKVAPSLYGKQGAVNLAGMGPSGRQVTAADYNATMFVEVVYTYKPLFWSGLLPSIALDEIASMAVRDSRLMGSPSDPSNIGTGTACS